MLSTVCSVTSSFLSFHHLDSVSALEWDPSHQILYIGGRFDMIDDQKIPGGLCMWTEETGLVPLEGSLTGFGLLSDSPNGEIISLAYESRSQVSFVHSVCLCLISTFPLRQSLFVAGSFYFVNGLPCTSVAVWNK
jgi:hypothetical protein